MSTTSIPLGNAEQLVNKINELQTSLQENSPGYESLLYTIHTNLAKDPDMVHLLTEEQIGVIVSGLSKKKVITIATTERKAPSTRAKLSQTKLEDI